MSRSIHETKRQLEDLKRDSYSDAEFKSRVVESHRETLRKKNLVKRLAKSTTTSPETELPSLPAIEILYRASSPEVRYLVSEAEVRGLISRLPVGILVGISSIDFCDGSKYMDESDSNVEGAERDPYVGRLGEKVGGQVYIPPVLGTYIWGGNLIAIYGYVFQDRDIRDNAFLTLCKIRILSTLLHEIAHHDDHMRRSGRGRWLGLQSARAEDYALRMEKNWSETILLDFLKDDLESETNELLRWLRQITTVDVSLSDVLSTTFVSNGWNAISGFVSLEQRTPDSLFQLAQDFHLNEQYDICLRCLDAILSSDSRNAGALCLKADTLIHLGMHEQADALVETVLQYEPRNFEALDLKCGIFWNQKKWPELLTYTEQALALVEPKRWYLRFTLARFRMMAFLHLGNLDAAREICLVIEERGSYKNRKRALLGFLELVANNTELAIRTCESILRTEKVYRFEKCVAYYTYELALRIRDKKGSYYQKPPRLIQTVENIGLVEVMERYFPGLQSSNI